MTTIAAPNMDVNHRGAGLKTLRCLVREFVWRDRKSRVIDLCAPRAVRSHGDRDGTTFRVSFHFHSMIRLY